MKKSAKENSRIDGKVMNAKGEVKYKIEGSFIDRITLVNCETKEQELVWEEPPVIPEAHLQYFFGKEALIMNHKTEEMDGVIAPTDCRYRKDLQYCEAGNYEECDR